MGEAIVVYFLSEFEDGGYVPCLCREGDRGYWNWGPDKAAAQEEADKRNALVGIVPLEALRIQLGTMR